MRTNVEIDDALVAKAMEVTGLRTKRAAIDEALHRLVDAYQRRRAIADMAGLGWEGDLASTREDRLSSRRP